jgi:tetratricopeptide (TPR) repeat protein
MMRPRLIALLLTLVTLVLYWPVWQHAFIAYDDPEYVAENRVVQAGLTGAGVKWAFTTFHAANWHPLTWLSHMLDCEWFGAAEGAHHFVNVLLHLANAILFFVAWQRATGQLGPAAMVAALFAWHPLHVETVAWVSERKDVLSTFFCALAMYLYVIHGQERRAAPAGKTDKAVLVGTPFRSKYFCGSLICFALALLAKPMPVTLPFVLVLMDFWPLNRVAHEGRLAPTFRRLAGLLGEKWPFLILSAASGVITVIAQRSGQAVASFEQFSLSVRLGNAATAYWRYLVKTFYPVDLAVLYPMPAQISSVLAVGAALGLVGVLIACWRWRRTAPYLLVGWLWFLGMLVPVIGLVQVGGQAMADRYTYVPLLGIFVMIAFGARDLASRFSVKPALIALTAVVLVACVFLTARQVRFWRDSETLFAHTVAVTKNNGVARLHLADALARKGRREFAFLEYQEALRLLPNLSQAHNNFALLLKSMGRNEEALEYYQNAIRLEPNTAFYHSNLGEVYAELNRPEDAFRCFSEAARLDPANPQPQFLLGRTRMRQGRSAEAIKHFQDALQRNPDDVDSLTFLARLLAASPDAALRNGPRAVTLAERATELSGGTEAYVLDTLAVAYAETGRFDYAREIAGRAMSLALQNKRTILATEIEKRWKLFQAEQPFRETNSAPPTH